MKDNFYEAVKLGSVHGAGCIQTAIVLGCAFNELCFVGGVQFPLDRDSSVLEYLFANERFPSMLRSVVSPLGDFSIIFSRCNYLVHARESGLRF